MRELHLTMKKQTQMFVCFIKMECYLKNLNLNYHANVKYINLGKIF